MDPPRSWRSPATARRSRPRARSRQRSARQRVVLLLDRGDGETTMIECDADDGIEVTEGDDDRLHPRRPRPCPARRDALPEIRPTPATRDPHRRRAPASSPRRSARSTTSREITLALAKAFGGLTVATAEFATQRPRAADHVRRPRGRARRARRRRRAVRAVIRPEQPRRLRRDPRAPRSPRSPPASSRPQIVDALRAAGDHVPELCLVALDDDEIVGHVMLSRGARRRATRRSASARSPSTPPTSTTASAAR